MSTEKQREKKKTHVEKIKKCAKFFTSCAARGFGSAGVPPADFRDGWLAHLNLTARRRRYNGPFPTIVVPRFGGCDFGKVERTA
jgi:hypothetical protein